MAVDAAPERAPVREVDRDLAEAEHRGAKRTVRRGSRRGNRRGDCRGGCHGLSLSMLILAAFLEIHAVIDRTDIPQFNDNNLVDSGSHARGH